MRIQEKIDNFILAKKEDRPYSGKINASGLGHCYRKQYWRIMREEPSNPIETRVLRVFEAGNIFHEFVQNIIKEEPGIEVEKKYEDDIVSLRVDMVDADTVYELKTVHSRAFWHMKNSKTPITEQKRENILQACCGAKYLGKKKIHICFISKDDLCVYEIHMEVTDEWLKAVEGEISTMSDFLLKQTLPPPQPRLWKDKDGKSRECQFCDFKNKCFALQKEEK